MSYRLGVDVGGTFTDFVLLNVLTGDIHRGKCLTTPSDPIQGIMQGVTRMREEFKLAPGAITGFAHATTLVANTLIERKGVTTGLFTTAGFRDVLELGSDSRYDMFDLDITFPEPLAPRELRFGITERTDATGRILSSPDADEVRQHAANLLAAGARAVGVCFLHSYRNPANEIAVRDLLKREFPQLDVSISSDIAPEIREYQRTVTVLANAYVRPSMHLYLSRLQQALFDAEVKCGLLVMLSNGGVTTAALAALAPVRLVESGPAAGILAACHYGKSMREANLIAFDMGGTTAKVCLIDNGEPAYTGTIEVARVKRQFRGSGLPLKVPSIEMIEIGAGGGSIARVDQTGLLKVGPDSAGAAPGPACYGAGGELPTVTDADLVLGYVDPGYFLGGEMKLDRGRAEAAIARVAKPLGLSITEAAAGIVKVVNHNMAAALRIHTAERGKDYRKYPLFAFGGAGPVHACGIARVLKLPKVICPLGAGTNSALGLLVAPPAVDLSRSYYGRLDKLDLDFLNSLYRDMEEQGRRMLSEAGIAQPGFTREAEMRFVGQGFEVTAAIPPGVLDTPAIDAIKQSFFAAYSRLYRSLPGDLPIEGLTWRLRAAGPAPELAPVRTDARSANADALKGRRSAHFPENNAFVMTPVYDRYLLRAGTVLEGPAIVEERESTVVATPGTRVTIDEGQNLTIEWTR